MITSLEHINNGDSGSTAARECQTILTALQRGKALLERGTSGITGTTVLVALNTREKETGTNKCAQDNQQRKKRVSDETSAGEMPH